MQHHVIRGLRLVCGVALVAGGAILSVPFIPGPGFVLVLGGLALLGKEFHWAHRTNVWLRRQGRRMLGGRDGGHEGQ